MIYVVLVDNKVVYKGEPNKALEMYDMHKQGQQQCLLLRMVDSNE